MPGPVERWLETFMCKQYADTFEAYGFKTLQSVCQLQLPQLQAMGVAQEHCEKILENVHVLRQTIYGTVNHYQDDLYSGGGGNSARIQGQGYHQNSSQGMPGMPPASNFPPQGQANFSGRQQGQMIQGHFSGPDGMYRGQQPQHFIGQSYGGQQGSTGQGHYGGQFGQMGGGYGQGNGNYGGGPMQGNLQQSQKPMQQGGPHSGQMQRHGMLVPGQNPQDVANSILQMTAAYQPNQTVQVPISKSRPAPYHIPKSPHYNMSNQGSSPTHQLQQQQQQQYSGGPGGRQFVYPSSSPHHSHPSRTSPISPGPGYMHSPASHHSGQSLPNSSPRSIQSPPLHTGPTSVKSPVAPQSPSGGLKSPCSMQSPANSGQGSICSPTPLNQQLHVSVSGQGHHTNYPVQSPTLQMKNISRYSPKTNPISPASQISSPYTPLSKSSIQSPPQVEQFASPHNTQDFVNDTAHETSNSKSGPANNPLMSLQKLCMLPEKQVVDPKSVVNDACLPSPQNPKNSDSNADSQVSSAGNNHGDGNCGSALESSNSDKCSDGQHCNEENQDAKHSDRKDDTKNEQNTKCVKNAQQNSETNEKKQTESDNTVKTAACDSPPRLISDDDMCGKTVIDKPVSDLGDKHINDTAAKLPNDSKSKLTNDTVDKFSNDTADKHVSDREDKHFSDTESKSEVHMDNKGLMNGDIQSDGLSSIPTDEEGELLGSEDEEDSMDVPSRDLKQNVLTPRLSPNSALNKAKNLNYDVKLMYSDDYVINGKNHVLDSNKCIENLKLPTSKNEPVQGSISVDKKEISDLKNGITDSTEVDAVKKVEDNDSDFDVKITNVISKEEVAKVNKSENGTYKNHHITKGKKTELESATTTQLGKEKVETGNGKTKTCPKQFQPERTRSLRNVPARLASAAYYNHYSDSDSNDEGILLVRKDNRNTYSRLRESKSPKGSEESSSDEVSEVKLDLSDVLKNESGNPGNHKNNPGSGDEIDGSGEKSKPKKNNICDKPKKQLRKNKMVERNFDENYSSDSDVNPGRKFNTQTESTESLSETHTRTSKRINRKRKKAPMAKYGDLYFGGDYVLDSEEEMEMERKSKQSEKTCDNITKNESIVILDSDDDYYIPKVKHSKKTTEIIVKSGNDEKCEQVTIPSKSQGLPKVESNVPKKSKSDTEQSSSNKDSSSSAPMKKRRGRPPGSTSKGSGKGKLKKLEKSKSKRAFICSDNESISDMKLKRTVEMVKKKHRKKTFDGKSVGPFIRMKGPVESPEMCVVVNSANGEKEIDSKSNKHKKKSTAVSVSTVHMSRLPSEKSVLVPSSTVMESENKWVCALCKKHSSYKFLGDLFGPYYTEGNLPQPKVQASPVNDSINKKRKKSLDNVTDAGEKTRKKSRKPSQSTPQEVWVHEDCLAWGDGVLLIGPRIYGLEEACQIASATMCSQCKETGAMIGCLHKGCSQKYHYICAVESGCYLDEENFSLLCPKHKDKKMHKTTTDTSKT